MRLRSGDTGKTRINHDGGHFALCKLDIVPNYFFLSKVFYYDPNTDNYCIF